MPRACLTHFSSTYFVGGGAHKAVFDPKEEEEGAECPEGGKEIGRET